MRRGVYLVFIAVTSCQDVGGTQTVAGGDVAAYETYVHPILEARCATIDCHGAPGRPLRLYAETGLRASDELRDRPITSAELADNVRSLAAIEPNAAPESSEVISKPLAGGLFHEGGVVWTSATENQVVCVRGWLAGQSGDATIVAACQAALAEPSVMLRDP
jgi:hypothetical protein